MKTRVIRWSGRGCAGEGEGGAAEKLRWWGIWDTVPRDRDSIHTHNTEQQTTTTVCCMPPSSASAWITPYCFGGGGAWGCVDEGYGVRGIYVIKYQPYEMYSFSAFQEGRKSSATKYTPAAPSAAAHRLPPDIENPSVIPTSTMTTAGKGGPDGGGEANKGDDGDKQRRLSYQQARK